MTWNSNFAEYAGEHKVRPYSSTSGAGFRASVEINFVSARSRNTKLELPEIWYNMKTDAGGNGE